MDKLIEWSEAAVKWAWKKYNKIREDDIFQPKVIYTDVSSANHRWDGARRSPQEKLRYAGHNGVYWAGLHWSMGYDDDREEPSTPPRTPRQPDPSPDDSPSRHEK